MSNSKEDGLLMENKMLFSTKEISTKVLERKLAMDTLDYKMLKVIKALNMKDNGLMIEWKV